MKALFPGLLLAILLGCCPKPVMVSIPCPPPPVIQKPASRVDKLRPESPLEEVARAYALDLAEALGYAAQLEAALDAYRSKSMEPRR